MGFKAEACGASTDLLFVSLLRAALPGDLEPVSFCSNDVAEEDAATAVFILISGLVLPLRLDGRD